MNTLVKYLLVSVCALTLLGAQVAQARTPTPSPTPTPGVTSTPTASPTPSGEQVSTFEGGCWLDALPCAGETMTARIGGKVCATDARPITPPGGRGPVGRLRVPSQDIIPGCGYEGATVEFFVGDQRAMRTGVWHAGSDQIMGFVAGHPFARFSGFLSVNQDLHDDDVLIPYVRDIACGAGRSVTLLSLSQYSASSVAYPFESEVYSNEQQVGCGVEGAEVTSKLLDAQGNVIAVAEEKGIWHVWDGVSSIQRINLTMIPVGGITLGNVGSGPGTGADKAPWVGVALAALGLSGIAVGFALRRRAAR